MIGTIKQKIQEKVMDTSTLEDDLKYYFTQWFQGLVGQGMQIISPPPPAPEGAEAAPPAGG